MMMAIWPTLLRAAQPSTGAGPSSWRTFTTAAQIWMNGKGVGSSSTAWIDVRNPATQEKVGRLLPAAQLAVAALAAWRARAPSLRACEPPLSVTPATCEAVLAADSARLRLSSTPSGVAGALFGCEPPLQQVNRVPEVTREEFAATVSSAQRAQPAWAATPITQRQRVMARLAELIRTHTDELAVCITTEQGKTLQDARGDVFRGLEVHVFGPPAPCDRVRCNNAIVLALHQVLGYVCARTISMSQAMSRSYAACKRGLLRAHASWRRHRFLTRCTRGAQVVEAATNIGSHLLGRTMRNVASGGIDCYSHRQPLGIAVRRFFVCDQAGGDLRCDVARSRRTRRILQD